MGTVGPWYEINLDSHILSQTKLLATVFEGILFAFALFKTCESTYRSLRQDTELPLHSVLLRDNIVYFFGCVELFLLRFDMKH